MTNVYWGAQGAMAAGASPTVLMLGDSWFWYPLDNLARELSSALQKQTFVVIGNNGAEAAQWSEKYRKPIDYAFKFYAKGAQALMLSGGGNDIAGMSDFLRIINDDCSACTTVDGCFKVGQPEATIAKIIGAYKEVILKFRAHNAKAPIVTHNYDYAWPTGKGLFGPSDWLKAPMDFAKVPEKLRRDVFRKLIKLLGDAQSNLKKDKAMGPIVAVNSAGTLPEKTSGVEQWWANELHPTPKGFKKLVVDAFLPELKKIPLK